MHEAWRHLLDVRHILQFLARFDTVPMNRAGLRGIGQRGEENFEERIEKLFDDLADSKRNSNAFVDPWWHELERDNETPKRPEPLERVCSRNSR